MTKTINLKHGHLTSETDKLGFRTVEYFNRGIHIITLFGTYKYIQQSMSEIQDQIYEGNLEMFSRILKHNNVEELEDLEKDFLKEISEDMKEVVYLKREDF